MSRRRIMMLKKTISKLIEQLILEASDENITTDNEEQDETNQ